VASNFSSFAAMRAGFSFSCYLESGSGWYHASFYPESSEGWNTIRLDKAEFGTEGRPTVGAKSVILRISAWRASLWTRVSVAGPAPDGALGAMPLWR